MIKSYLRNLGGKIIYRLVKYIVILLIAIITWEGFIKDKSESRGKKLYHESKQFYKEAKHGIVTPTYDMREDSSSIYFIEK